MTPTPNKKSPGLASACLLLRSPSAVKGPAPCMYEEFNTELKTIQDLLRKVDGSCLATNSYQKLDSSMVILKNVSELEDHRFGVLVSSLNNLNENDYFHFMYSQNEIIKKFIINTIDVILNSDAGHRLKRSSLSFLMSLISRETSQDDSLDQTPADERAKLDSYSQFFAKNLQLFIEFISIDSRELETSPESPARSSSSSSRNSLVVPEANSSSPQSASTYESTDLKMQLVNNSLKILPFAKLMQHEFFLVMINFFKLKNLFQFNRSLKVTTSLLRKLSADDLFESLGAIKRETLDDCFYALCMFVKTSVLYMLNYTVIRMNLTLLVIEREFGNFHFKYLSTKPSARNAAILSEVSHRILKSIIKSIRVNISELYASIDLGLISQHLDVFEINVWNHAVEETYEVVHHFMCLLIKLVYWCSVNAKTNPDIDHSELVFVEKKILQLVVTLLRQKRIKGDFFVDYWKNLEELWRWCFFRQSHKNESPILITYLCASHSPKTLPKVRFFGKTMKCFFEEKLLEASQSRQARADVVNGLTVSTTTALGELVRVYSSENMAEEFRTDLLPALDAYQQIASQMKLASWFNLNLKFYPRLLSDKTKPLRQSDSESLWSSYLAKATDMLEQLLDGNSLVVMDNYFIYDCLRLVKTLIEFYDQQEMREHKWLIERLITFAIENINYEEKFASSLKENITYLANEIRQQTKQLN